MSRSKRKGRRRRQSQKAKQKKLDNQSDALHKDSSKNVVDLTRWLKHNGYRNETNLGVYHTQLFGYGLFTSKQAILANKCVLSFPSKFLISAPVLRIYKPSIYGCFTNNMQCLIAFVMNEGCDKQSPWSEYFKLLPQSFSSLPCTWPVWESRKSIKTMPESYLFDLLHEAAKIRAVYYDMLAITVKHRDKLYYTEGNLLDWDLFEWAYCIVNTRCLHLPLSNTNPHLSDTIALVPYFDLLNHSPDAEQQLRFCPKTGDLQLHTLNPIKPYSQLYIKYNNYNNRELMRHYGYVTISDVLMLVDTESESNLTYIKPSQQDVIPVSYYDVRQLMVYLDAGLAKRGLPVHLLKRLDSLQEIGFITPVAQFDLTWPNSDYFANETVIKIKDNLDVINFVESPSVISVTENNISSFKNNFNLDWSFDKLIQLLARSKWDSNNKIKSLIYSDDSKENILSAKDTKSWLQYYRLWIGIIEWTLRAYNGLKCNSTCSLTAYLATIKHVQLRTLIGNEIGLLLCLREEMLKIHDSLVMTGQTNETKTIQERLQSLKIRFE